jgi:hypothetical protein
MDGENARRARRRRLLLGSSAWRKAYKTTEKQGVRSVGVELGGNAEKFGRARLVPSRLGGELLIQNGAVGRRKDDVEHKKRRRRLGRVTSSPPARLSWAFRVLRAARLGQSPSPVSP